jgi:hypothetical protein
MSDLHIAGSDLRFELTVLRDGVAPGVVDPLLTATLHYTAPDGTTGTWVGTIDDDEAGTVHHDVAAVDNDTAGRWTVWADATFTAGGTLVTGAATVMIYPAGTVSPA